MINRHLLSYLADQEQSYDEFEHSFVSRFIDHIENDENMEYSSIESISIEEKNNLRTTTVSIVIVVDGEKNTIKVTRETDLNLL